MQNDSAIVPPDNFARRSDKRQNTMKFAPAAKVSLLLTCFVALLLPGWAAQAQLAVAWQPPAKIPGLSESGLDPVFVTDSAGSLHLFHSQPVGDYLRIFYIRWSLQEGWSTLVDIITAPRGGARVYGACLDQQGWMHLLFFGGDDLQAEMYYTKAPALSAGKSTAWSAPRLIGDAAITPSDGDLFCDGKGFLMAAYSGKLKGNGIYMLQSLDHGQTWSQPEPLFITYSDALWPYAFRFSPGTAGNAYAVWSLKDETGNSQAVYFARFAQPTLTWSPPFRLASVTEFTADTPNVIEHQGQLIAIYHNGFPSTRWMRTSPDAGETWSSPVRLFEQVGSNGAASLVVDSQERLSVLFGNRVGDPAIHGVWQSDWLGQRWSQPVGVVAGPQIVVGPNGEEGFDPSFIQAEVIQGNLLFALWRHDPRAGPTNIWYAYRLLDSPALPTHSVPTVWLSPTPTIPPLPDALGTPEPPAQSANQPPAASPTATFDKSAPANTNINNPNTSILVGIVPVGLLILLAIFIQRRQR
jgi:hypothetical protein